ncbi:MAG: AI-2E family transporter, partial [Clostridiales bacterium]|nr:AI-2E family transporter [Clostridiales bacterium]
MNFRKYMGIILNIVVPLAIIYAVCVWGLRLVVFFLPFVIGWIVAMIANPLVRFLERKLKIVRRHGSVILVVGVLGLVIFGFYGLCSWLFQEMTEFVQALPEIYGSVQGEVNQAYARIGGLLKYLPADTENTIGAILENAGGYIGDFVQKIAASAGGRVVRTLPEVFVNAIIICLSSYLFLADHDRIVETVKQFTPEP